MTTWYRYHPGAQLALLGCAGELSRGEWEQAVLGMLDQAPRTERRRILSDRRLMGAAYPLWMEELVLKVVREHRDAFGATRWAVLVPAGAPAFQLVQTAGELTRGTQVQIQPFPELVAALRWLLGVVEQEDLQDLVTWIDREVGSMRLAVGHLVESYAAALERSPVREWAGIFDSVQGEVPQLRAIAATLTAERPLSSEDRAFLRAHVHQLRQVFARVARDPSRPHPDSQTAIQFLELADRIEEGLGGGPGERDP